MPVDSQLPGLAIREAQFILQYFCVLLTKGKILLLETTMGHSLIVLKEVVSKIRDNCSDYCWVNIVLPVGT